MKGGGGEPLGLGEFENPFFVMKGALFVYLEQEKIMIGDIYTYMIYMIYMVYMIYMICMNLYDICIYIYIYICMNLYDIYEFIYAFALCQISMVVRRLSAFTTRCLG